MKDTIVKEENQEIRKKSDSNEITSITAKPNLINSEIKPENKLGLSNADNNEMAINALNSNNLNPNKEDEENSNIAINNESQNNKSEKEDNNSDLSSLVNQKIDNQEIKIVKKTKMKKADFDRKSHLSHNIEGVIFEDINEDEEWEEKEKLNVGSSNAISNAHKNSFEDIYDKDSMNIKNEILKKLNSNNQNTHNLTITQVSNQGKKNNLSEDNYFENIDFNDANVINIMRNNSLDNSKDHQNKVEVSKSKIMQDLLKHRNLPINNDKSNINDVIENNNKTLKHFNSNPIQKTNQNMFNRDNNVKEKFITFENENENDNNKKNTKLNNLNNKQKIDDISNKNNLNNEKDINGNKIDPKIEDNSIFKDIKIENLGNENTSNINYIIEKIKKERQKDMIIKDIKEKISNQSNDEADFYEVTKTIRFHKSSDKDEILKEIIQGNIKNFIQKGEILESLISLSGLKKKESEINPNKKHKHSKKHGDIMVNTISNDKKDKESSISPIKEFDNELKGVVEIMQGLNQTTKSEKLKSFINCKNSALNLLTKTKYSENKSFRLRVLNGITFILIIIVFLIYHYYLRHL